MWVNENGILMDDRIPQQPDFFRKSQKYFRLMTCKCGQQFELRTPYELCNPELRDLCSDCIEKLPPQTPTTTTKTKLRSLVSQSLDEVTQCQK